MKVTALLRAAGIPTDTDIMGRKLAKAMKSASDSGARCAVIVGAKESEDDAVTVRDMVSGAQTVVGIADLADFIRRP